MGNNTRLQLTAIVASGVLAACASTAPSTPAAAQAAGKSTAHEAEVNLASASGSLVSGHLAIRPMGDGVHITGEVGGLKPGDTRGFHIHEKGDCSAADASSAGAHFNPGAQPHGRATHGAHHAGDSDNITADTDGNATVQGWLEGATVGDGAATDIVGKAVIVHADEDDYATQPTGNAGDRLACGVIAAR